MAQWLSLCSSTAKGVNSIPGWGTKILHAEQCGPQKRKKKMLNINHINCTVLFYLRFMEIKGFL